MAGFKYSAAMREAGGSWGFEDLNVFLSDPARAMPGTGMDFVGIHDDAERAGVVAFLRTRSDAPVPLPR
jgi:cytochrome c